MHVRQNEDRWCRQIYGQGPAMSQLTARIKAFQNVVRDAMHDELSLEEQTELAAVIEDLRLVVTDQDLPPGDGPA